MEKEKLILYGHSTVVIMITSSCFIYLHISFTYLHYYGKVENVLVVLLVLKGVTAEEAIMIEEEAAVRREEEAFLAAGLLISLLRAFIRDQITVIIVI